MKLPYLKQGLKLNKLRLPFILYTLYFIFQFTSCTRIYVIESPVTNRQELQFNNHARDFNPKNQSLYINFLNSDTKQIVTLEMVSSSTNQIVKFKGTISDYSNTYSQKIAFTIPIEAFSTLNTSRITGKSFLIEVDEGFASNSDSLQNKINKYFEIGLPALVHSVENYYSEEGIVQTMNGVITTPLNSQVRYYAISDFVPLIIWGGALLAGGIITHFSVKGKSIPCEEIEFHALELCDNKRFREKVRKHCECDCIEKSNGKWIVQKRD